MVRPSLQSAPELPGAGPSSVTWRRVTLTQNWHAFHSCPGKRLHSLVISELGDVMDGQTDKTRNMAYNSYFWAILSKMVVNSFLFPLQSDTGTAFADVLHCFNLRTSSESRSRKPIIKSAELMTLDNSRAHLLMGVGLHEGKLRGLWLL